MHAMEPLCDRGFIYSSYTFLTSALEGEGRTAPRPGRALSWGKKTRYQMYGRLCLIMGKNVGLTYISGRVQH
jgi:hypothetical protein